jgi:hypothetical protein
MAASLKFTAFHILVKTTLECSQRKEKRLVEEFPRHTPTTPTGLAEILMLRWHSSRQN